MNDTQAILAAQRQEFSRWEGMLAGITEDTAAVFHPSAGMSIKDVVAHLMAWQQVSIARLEAARLSREPVLPDWLAGEDPESEEHIEQFNARIQATYAPRPWPAVYQAWREGYLRLVALAEEMPVDDLVAGDRFPWLKGYALVDVLAGSLEHHIEHVEALHAERMNRTMNAETRALLADIRSPDAQKQNATYFRLLELTDQPVDWAYDAWDELLEGLGHKDNHVRAISAQVLCNLAKSDPELRMLTDFGALLAVTRDDRFVTARHCLQSLWKVGAAGTAQGVVYLDGLATRFHECASEKNCTLIRHDIIQSLRAVYDAAGGSSDVAAVKTRALALIETEADPKYRKKYATVWKDARPIRRVSPVMTTTAALIVKPYSAETWPDFEALFGKHKGVRGGCWCTFHRCTSTEYNRMTRDERRDFQKSLAEAGRGYGLLVYEAETPVAWCQFGPAEGFPQYDRGREYRKLGLPAEPDPLWRIACLFVDKHHRRRGLSAFALRAALESIGRLGGGTAEAFPLDVPGARYPQYTGSPAMYRREGFAEIARLGASTLLMRRIIDAGNPPG